jgi:glycosyltransferase involved in cell wall biosynthesis
MFLSIVIPAFNAANHIKRTIQSIGEQSNNDLEIIIVDDGSLDHTASIAENFLKDLRIETYQIIRKANGGVSSARNVGMEASKGDYTLFLDADDYIEPSLVECLYEVTQTDYPDTISWVFESVSDNGNIITNYFERVQARSGKRSGIDMLHENLIENSMWLWTGNIAYNRNFLISNHRKYSEGCTSGEDTEFILVSLALAKDSVFIKQTLSYYVEREGSITNSYNVRKFDAIQALQRTGEYFKQLKNPKLYRITKYILSELTVASYLKHYETGIAYLINEGNMSLNCAVDKMESDIECHYQTLSSDIKKLIEIRKERGIKANIKVQLFKASPKLCFLIMGIYKKFKLECQWM